MDKNNIPRAGVSSSFGTWRRNAQGEPFSNFNPLNNYQSPLRGHRIQRQSLAHYDLEDHRNRATPVQPNTRNIPENLCFDSERVMRDVIKQYPPKKRPYQSQYFTSSNEVHRVKIPNESNRFLDVVTYNHTQMTEPYDTDMALEMNSTSSSPDTFSNVISLPPITEVSHISNVLENSLNSMPNIKSAIIIPVVLCNSNKESTTNRSTNTGGFSQSESGIERNYRTEFAQDASMRHYGGRRQIQDMSRSYNVQEVRSTFPNIHYQKEYSVINLEAQQDSSNDLADSDSIFSTLNHSTHYLHEMLNSEVSLHPNSESRIDFRSSSLTQNNFHFSNAQNQTQINASLQQTLLSTQYESESTEHDTLKYMPNVQQRKMSNLPYLYDVNKSSSSDPPMSYTNLPSTSQFLQEIPLRSSVIDYTHNVRSTNSLLNQASVNQPATSTRFPIISPWARSALIPEEVLNGNSDPQPLQPTETVVATRGRGSRRGRGRGANPRQVGKRTTPATKRKLKDDPIENPTLSPVITLACTSVVPKKPRVTRKAKDLQLETKETMHDVASLPNSQLQNIYAVQNPQTTTIRSSDEKKVEFCMFRDSMYLKDDHIESSEEKLAKDKIKGGVKDIRTGVVDIMRIMKEKIREEAVRDYLSGKYSLPPNADSSALSIITIDEDIEKTSDLTVAVCSPKSPSPK